MGRPIEIECALNTKPDDDSKATFYLLQIRPIVDAKNEVKEDLSVIKQEDTLIHCNKVLGQGIMNDVFDVVM